jgi:hypothetical protein
MPEETEAPATQEAPATDAPAEADGAEQESARSGSDWFREQISGRSTAPVESKPSRNRQWDEANAELRRGRGKRDEDAAEAGESDAEAPEADQQPKERESAASRPERDDDEAFQRQVQAEVDRREAVRNQRAESQRERELRRTNPQEYAKYKEQQEANSAHIESLMGSLKMLSGQFDDAAITPLVTALPETERAKVLNDPGHGIDGRKEIVRRSIEALKKTSYDEGVKAGKNQAQKSLRQSPAFRKELLSEIRGEDDEPELAASNGTVNGNGGGGDWDMNDWMRSVTGRSSRRTRE